MFIGAGDSLYMSRRDSNILKLIELIPSTTVIKYNRLFVTDPLISTSFAQDFSESHYIIREDSSCILEKHHPTHVQTFFSLPFNDVESLTDSMFMTEGCHPSECALRRASSLEH